MNPKTSIFLLLIGLQFITYSQDNKSAFGKEPNSQLKSMYAEPYKRKAEIKLDGKKYRIYNNYVTLGVGKCYNSVWKDAWINTGVDFNFHIQKTYFQMGGYVQGPAFYNKQQVQMHMGVGYRKESYKYFWAAYGGLGYTNGFYPVKLKDIAGNDSLTIHPIMSEMGVYAAFQYFYKLKFDYGLGATAFADYNKIQYTVGLRIELFFSGAYRGTILHKDEE